MKIIKDLMNKHNPVVQEIKIPSKRDEQVEYSVKKFKNGKITCECMRFKMGQGTCTHIEEFLIRLGII